MADTRKDKRAPVSLKVRFKSATVDEFIEQYSRDISRGGIFIKSKTPMSVGTLLKFEFQLKDESRLIHGVGRVVWKRDESETTNGSPPGMGIKFIKMDPESRSLVEKIVSTRGHDGGAFEEGQNDPEESQEPSGGTPFFPTTSTEAEMPRPEDRTQIRDASEFLASALAGAGEDAAAEAEASAEHARKRTEEIQREREAAERARREQEEREDSERAAQAREISRPVMSEPPTALYQMPAPISQSRRSSAPPLDDAREVAAQSAWGASTVPMGASTPPGDIGRAPEHSLGSGVKPQEAKPSARSGPLRLDEPPRPAASAGMSGGPASRAIPMLIAVAVIGVAIYLFARSSSEENAEPEGLDGVAAETVEPATPPAAAEPPSVGTATPTKQAAPAVPTVSVRVESTPAGGLVRVNGEQRGTTPTDVQLPVGQEVTLAVKAPGHVGDTRQVTAQQGQEAIRIELAALPYVLEVESTPAGARVTAGGRNAVAPGEIQLRDVRGPVSVVATKPGFERVNVSVTPDSFAERDGTMRHRITLTLPERVRPAPAPQKAPPAAGPADERPAGEAPTPPAEATPAPTPAPTEQPGATPAPTPAPEAPAPLPDNPFN